MLNRILKRKAVERRLSSLDGFEGTALTIIGVLAVALVVSLVAGLTLGQGSALTGAALAVAVVVKWRA